MDKMKKICIIILTALALMGGCKTKEKAPKPNEESVTVDTLAAQDSTAINVEISTGNDVGQEEIPVDDEIIVPLVNTSGEVVVVHINTTEILTAMPETAKAEQELTAYRQELENQINAMGEEYLKKVQEYEAAQDSLSDLMKTTKQNEILDMQNRIQMFQENAEKDLVNKQVALYEPIREKLQKAVRAVTLEQGYTYMMDIASGAIVYIGDDAIDATPLVKRKLGIK